MGPAIRESTNRRSSSPFCALGIGDAELRDVAFGSLSPILVAFVEADDLRWEDVAELLESVASERLRCLLADPVRCRTAASLLGHTGGFEMLLVAHGRVARRIDAATTAPGLVEVLGPDRTRT